MQSKTFKKVLSLVLSVAMLAVSLFTGVTVAAEDSLYDAQRINIHPGIDDTYLNFTWQSEEKAAVATVRMKAEGSDTWLTFTGESTAFVIKDGYEEGYHDTFVKNCGHTCAAICGHEACTASQCYHGTYTLPYYNRVTAKGLEYGVNYTYQLGDGTSWSKEYTTRTSDTDPNEEFSYLVFGDSQTADQYYGDYMKKALELSTQKFSDVDFLMNLGDNVHENNDRNYNAYYTAQSIFDKYPIAVVTGNHELNLCTNGDRINFADHPTLALQYSPAADARSDYWFRYGDVLFITFNSGPQQTSMMADLEQLIIDAKAAHPDTRWTILQTHQGFYSNNGGGKVWRVDFTKILQKYDIDLVFNGHHHMYTRTESLLYDSTLTCTHSKSSPVFSCAACSGYIEPLGENDVTVKDTFVGATKTTEPYYQELEGVEYDKTVVRYDPEGITYIHLDSLTAEGHDQYATIAGSTLAATNAYSVNTKEGQGAITKVTVGKDENGNDELKVETYWINNGGTKRVSDSKPLSLLDDDYIEDTPYDTYTIKKTTPTKDVEITFDGGADRSIFTRKINSGEAVEKPANPILTGKSFKYWTADGETEFDFATTFTSDTILTAVYEDIPPTTTANLFVEAVNRGDKEIILEADITLDDCDVITVKSGTEIKSAEGKQYTLTLDGNTRLATAAGSTVTLRNVNITIAETIDTISNGYNQGGFIRPGSGNSKLYIYNCNIRCAATNMGASNCAVIRPVGNTYSYVYIYDSTISANVGNEQGAIIGGEHGTFYATNSTLKPKASNYWISADNPTLILKGTSTYTGWCSNSAKAKIFDFSNATVKIARNKDNLIELTKIGSGAAVSSDNYKIYYAFEDTAFAEDTAIEYTGPIADVDFETEVYATIKYVGKSYYGEVTSKICAEYIEGVTVNTADSFIAAINNGDTPITLTADITLTDLGKISFGANTVVKSKTGAKYCITMEGTSRFAISNGKTVKFQNLDVIFAENSAIVANPWSDGDKITVGNANGGATLYVEGCTIENKAADIGASDNAVILSYQNTASKIYITDSTVKSAATNGNGCLLFGGDHNATFRISNSTMQAVDSSAWFCNSGAVLVLVGTTSTRGWIHSSAYTYDLTNTTVKAARNKDNLVELSKIGSGTMVGNAGCKIYYSIGEDKSGTTNAYTAPIADIGYDTPIYVTVRYNETAYYTDVEEKVCGEYIEGVAVGDAEGFKNAIANGESLITLTADIILNELGNITIGANTTVQSKTGAQYSITLDGNTRLIVSAGKTVTLKGIKVYIAETAATINSDNGYYYGYITVRNNAKLYIVDSRVESLSKDLGSSQTAMIKIYRESPTNGYVEIKNSTIISPSGQNKGIALGAIRWTSDTKPVYRIIDSTVKGNWIFHQGNYIVEGTTVYSGYYQADSVSLVDFQKTSVVAKRDANGNVILSKTGTGTAVSSDSYKIYYSLDGATYTEYTDAITNIEADQTVYVKLGLSVTYKSVATVYYSTPAEFTVPEFILGDASGDWVVDATDLALARQHIMGITTVLNADMNNDGIVDICDIVAIAKTFK